MKHTLVDESNEAAERMCVFVLKQQRSLSNNERNRAFLLWRHLPDDIEA